MKLKDYLKLKELTVYEFADRCRLSYPTMYRAYNNYQVSKKTAKKIFVKSKGLVNITKIYIPTGQRAYEEEVNCNK